MHRFIATLIILITLLIPPAQAAQQPDKFMAGPVAGEVIDVLDGDTLTVRVHVWIGQTIETHVRLSGIDAPEIKGKCTLERQKAQAAKEELARLVSSGAINLYNVKLEKYAGRVLAQAKTAEGMDISRHMLEMGFARPYHGEKRQPWCTQR